MNHAEAWSTVFSDIWFYAKYFMAAGSWIFVGMLFTQDIPMHDDREGPWAFFIIVGACIGIASIWSISK